MEPLNNSLYPVATRGWPRIMSCQRLNPTCSRFFNGGVFAWIQSGLMEYVAADAGISILCALLESRLQQDTKRLADLVHLLRTGIIFCQNLYTYKVADTHVDK